MAVLVVVVVKKRQPRRRDDDIPLPNPHPPRVLLCREKKCEKSIRI